MSWCTSWTAAWSTKPARLMACRPFGRPLFVRSNRRVEVTPEGRRLFESLSRVLDALEASCSEVNLAAAAEVLAVHCAPSLAVKWLGPRLPGFMQAHPEITIRLSSGAEPLDLTLVREVDVAISYGYAHERPGVEVSPLGKERIMPLCAPKLVDPRRSAEELVAALILIDSQLSQVTWRDWFIFNELTLPPRPRPSFDRAALSISAAVDGMGVARPRRRKSRTCSPSSSSTASRSTGQFCQCACHAPPGGEDASCCKATSINLKCDRHPL